MIITGYTSSALEHLIWEQKYGPGGISAVKAIQIANEQGIPVYDIDSTNANLIDSLSISEDAKADMENAINAGYVIKTPSQNITYAGWTGIGYIVMNPETGEGRYEISEGSGGFYVMPAEAKKVGGALVIKQRTEIPPSPKDEEYYKSQYHHTRLVARELSAMGYTVVYGAPYSKAWLLRYLRLDLFNIFYFFGHGSDEHFEENRANAILITSYKGEEWLYYSEIPDVGIDQYKIVFINACYSAYWDRWAKAFKIDTSTEGLNKEAFIGTDLETYRFLSAAIWAQKFWEHLRRNPNSDVYDAASTRLPNQYLLPYGKDGSEWLRDPGVPYWQFRP